jgi:predicted nucleotidyltransferase
METIGALRRVEEGRRVRYEVVLLSPVWEAIGILAKASSDPSALIRDALIDIGGLHAAFIFGSTARGTQREDSDIDLFLVEDPRIDRKRLLRQLAEVEMILARDVNAVRYTPEALAERLGDPTHPAWRFVRDVLTGPKRWVAGTLSAIAPLAIAAGLGAADLAGSTA